MPASPDENVKNRHEFSHDSCKVDNSLKKVAGVCVVQGGRSFIFQTFLKILFTFGMCTHVCQTSSSVQDTLLHMLMYTCWSPDYFQLQLLKCKYTISNLN